MAKRFDEHNDENEREMQTIKVHLDRQDKQIADLSKKLDEVLNLLGGNVLFKTKGLVEVVDQISSSLEDMIGKFEHAEKWRRDFKSAQAEHEQRNQKKMEVADQREHDAKEKAKEIEALKRSNRIKNWIGAGAIAGGILKLIIDHYLK